MLARADSQKSVAWQANHPAEFAGHLIHCWLTLIMAARDIRTRPVTRRLDIVFCLA